MAAVHVSEVVSKSVETVRCFFREVVFDQVTTRIEVIGGVQGKRRCLSSKDTKLLSDVPENLILTKGTDLFHGSWYQISNLSGDLFLTELEGGSVKFRPQSEDNLKDQKWAIDKISRDWYHIKKFVPPSAMPTADVEQGCSQKPRDTTVSTSTAATVTPRGSTGRFLQVDQDIEDDKSMMPTADVEQGCSQTPRDTTVSTSTAATVTPNNSTATFLQVDQDIEDDKSKMPTADVEQGCSQKPKETMASISTVATVSLSHEDDKSGRQRWLLSASHLPESRHYYFWNYIWTSAMMLLFAAVVCTSLAGERDRFDYGAAVGKFLFGLYVFMRFRVRLEHCPSHRWRIASVMLTWVIVGFCVALPWIFTSGGGLQVCNERLLAGLRAADWPDDDAHQLMTVLHKRSVLNFIILAVRAAAATVCQLKKHSPSKSARAAVGLTQLMVLNAMWTTNLDMMQWCGEGLRTATTSEFSEGAHDTVVHTAWQILCGLSHSTVIAEFVLWVIYLTDRVTTMEKALSSGRSAVKNETPATESSRESRLRRCANTLWWVIGLATLWRLTVICVAASILGGVVAALWISIPPVYMFLHAVQYVTFGLILIFSMRLFYGHVPVLRAYARKCRLHSPEYEQAHWAIKMLRREAAILLCNLVTVVVFNGAALFTVFAYHSGGRMIGINGTLVLMRTSSKGVMMISYSWGVVFVSGLLFGGGAEMTGSPKKDVETDATKGSNAQAEGGRAQSQQTRTQTQTLEEYGVVTPEGDEREDIVNLAERGFSLSKLVTFFTALADGSEATMPHYDKRMSTTMDVVRGAIVPLTRSIETSHPMTHIWEEKAVPQRIVVHAWSMPFSDLVAAIIADVLDDEGTYEHRIVSGCTDIKEDRQKLESKYWLDIFSVNQHCGFCSAPEPRSDSTAWASWHRSQKDTVTGKEHPLCGCNTSVKFANSPDQVWYQEAHGPEYNHRDISRTFNIIRHLKTFHARSTIAETCHARPRFAMTVASDYEFDTFKRAWCIAEIAEAYKNDVPVRLHIHSAKSWDCANVELDVRECQASRSGDLERILERIEAKSSVNEFNDKLKRDIYGKGGLTKSWIDAEDRTKSVARIVSKALMEPRKMQEQAVNAVDIENS